MATAWCPTLTSSPLDLGAVDRPVLMAYQAAFAVSRCCWHWGTPRCSGSAGCCRLGSSLIVALATRAVAAVFQSARHRIQPAVNRRFIGVATTLGS